MTHHCGSCGEPDISQGIRKLLDVYEESQKRPWGPELPVEHRKLVGDACVELCGGDQDKARALWRVICDHCGGYFPHAAGVALIRATPVGTINLVPLVEAPDPQ